MPAGARCAEDRKEKNTNIKGDVSVKKKAFTLVEILIVIVIIGILAAFAMPSLTGSTESAKEAACNGEMEKIKNAISLEEFGTNADFAETVEKIMKEAPKAKKGQLGDDLAYYSGLCQDDGIYLITRGHMSAGVKCTVHGGSVAQIPVSANNIIAELDRMTTTLNGVANKYFSSRKPEFSNGAAETTLDKNGKNFAPDANSILENLFGSDVNLGTWRIEFTSKQSPYGYNYFYTAADITKMNVGDTVNVSAVITKDFKVDNNKYTEGTYTGQATVEKKTVEGKTVYYIKPIYSSLK